MIGTGKSDLSISAGVVWNNKGITKGQKALKSFQHTALSFGKTLGITFGATAIAAFGKASFNAFVADDKALKSLNQTLISTNNAFATTYVTDYIAKTEALTGVLDDSLRPAFQTLLTSTGSVIQSQKGLDTALNVSLGSGMDLVQVSKAIAKGYQGQFGAISKLNGGVSKAALASKDMNRILGELNANFAGQAAVFADSYAGKLAKINTAANNAKETIGKGLVDAITLVSDSFSTSGITGLFAKWSQDLADTLVGLGLIAKELSGIKDPLAAKTGGLPAWAKPGKAVQDFIFKALNPGNPFEYITKAGRQQRTGTSTNSGYQDPGMAKYFELQQLLAKEARLKLWRENTANQKAAKAEKERLRLLAIDNAATTEKLKLTGDQKVLDQLRQKFDVERIGIQYALTQASDITTKKVLEGQMAILDGDAKKAAEINYSLDWLQKHREASEAALAAADAAVVAELAKLSAESSKTAASLGSLGSASADAAMAQADAALAIADLAMNAAVAMEQLFASQQSGIDAWLNKLSGAAGVPPTSAPDSGGSYFNVPNSPGARGQALAQDISTNISGYVMPVVLTDSAGFDAAINKALQDAARKGFSQAGSASSYY